jgi:hypothetical protein
VPLTNRDLLAWFTEDERALCLACGENACVGLPQAPSIFCLACGAVWLGGERLDADRRIPTN